MAHRRYVLGSREYVELIELLDSVARPEDKTPAGTLRRLMAGRRIDDWVNDDVRRMADSLAAQEHAIADDEPDAPERRLRLNRAVAYLRLAFGELQVMRIYFARNAP